MYAGALERSQLRGRACDGPVHEAPRTREHATGHCDGTVNPVAIADMQQAIALGWTRPGGLHPRGWHRYLPGSERTWAIAFVIPYVAVLLVFAVYPVAYGLWMASAPSL